MKNTMSMNMSAKTDAFSATATSSCNNEFAMIMGTAVAVSVLFILAILAIIVNNFYLVSIILVATVLLEVIIIYSRNR